MSDLWIEKYRPQTLEEYVFKNDSQKAQVKEWIKNGIPHCLFEGVQGSGKCLAGSSLIDVEVEPIVFKQLVGTNISDNTVVTTTIKELFDAISRLDDHDWINDCEHYNSYNIRIKNHIGEWCDITHFITKLAPIITIICDDGSEISCADAHLIRNRGVNCVLANTLSVGDSIEKMNKANESVVVKIINISYHSLNDIVYDVSVDSPEHLYMTTNGFVHHNTSLAKMILSERKVNPGDVLFINASRERKPEDLQDKIINFASGFPLGDSKYLILDECLEEHEEIQMSDMTTVALKDMQDGVTYQVKSLNMATGEVEDDAAVVHSRKEDEVFRVELADGRTIHATLNHPFLVWDNGAIIEKQLKDLKVDDEIITC